MKRYSALEHPAISSLLRNGYPTSDLPECPYCHGTQGDWVFVLDDSPVCVDCFCDWVKDYVTTNPKEVATALAVTVHYVG